MDIKYIARLSFRVLVVILLTAVLGNICYHVIADGIRQVETAENVSAESVRTVSAVATVIRQEHVVNSSEKGVYLYSVDNGERVQVNKKILGVYSDTDDNKSAIERIKALDGDISVLESARTLESAYTSASLEKKLDEYTLALADAADKGNKKECDLIEESIRVLLCVKELKSGHTDYKTQLQELNAERESVVSNLGEPLTSIRSDSTGYFYYNVDGYEDALGTTDVLGLDIYGMRELSRAEQTSYENTAGKIVTDHTWYLAVPLTTEQSMNFTVGNDYSVKLGSGVDSVTMKLEKLVRKTGEQDAYLLLSCQNVTDGTDFPRHCRVEIEYERIEGFRIPVSAVRYLEGYTGVYVLHGSVVEFRRIEILTLDGAFVICDSGFVATDGSYKSLKSYDKIIVKGEGLYVGKIID